MTVQAILLPVFVQVLLCFGLLVLTGQRRFADVRAGAVRPGEVSLGEKAWPASSQQASNAYANQFELPVLFFALVPLALATRKADLLFVLMSWVFVGSRLAHAAVYVSRNHVPARFGAFLIGVLTLLAMWVIFAVRILSTPLPP